MKKEEKQKDPMMISSLATAALQLFLLAAAVAACLPASGWAAPVVDALMRPALMVRDPARSVLLGAARAGERLVAVGERGIIVVSEDGGQHWRQVPVPVSVTLTAVRFADARKGMAVGHGGTVLSTTDGGASWQRRLEGRQLARLALDAAVANGRPELIQDAERLVADGPDKPLLDLMMLDARRVLVVGAYGLAFYSQDGGANWTPWMSRLDNPKALHLYALRRHGDTLLMAGEQGLLLRSDDAGASFRRLPSPYQGSFFTAEMPTPAETVVAGLRGNVWHSSDAGA
ncbi:MAG: YCF48-related protein, partial [Pseudomonadota bacterium]